MGEEAVAHRRGDRDLDGGAAQVDVPRVDLHRKRGHSRAAPGGSQTFRQDRQGLQGDHGGHEQEHQHPGVLLGQGPAGEAPRHFRAFGAVPEVALRLPRRQEKRVPALLLHLRRRAPLHPRHIGPDVRPGAHAQALR